MSLDAGGLAQMTYNHNTLNGSLGLPGSGFASRGKNNNMKRLNLASPATIPTIDENQPAQPRTSRSHLLSGLRTAPKTPTFPTSAPPTQQEYPQGQQQSQQSGLDASRYSNMNPGYNTKNVPKTAGQSNFPSSYQNNYGQNNGHRYTPSQVLAPPSIQIADEEGEYDPALYDELVRTNQFLAAQQARLQQQLINVTAAAQQFQNMSLGQQQNVYGQMNSNAGFGMYQQQLQNGMQPIIEAVPNQPGLYIVYNPMTGQASYCFDQNAVQQAQPQQMQQAQYATQNNFANVELSHSPPPPTPTFRAQVSPPPEAPVTSTPWRSNSPPKTSPSPPTEKANPLPPPSANAFRPSHRKNLSLAGGFNGNPDGPKTGGLKTGGFPATPMTGTFGPGQAREGEHPSRQPRGPPSLEELVAKPTSKYEGSKNFVGRQRRRAVQNLVRAGLDRRAASRTGTGSVDSAEGMTPTSEKEITFSDSDSVRSGSASLSRKPSLGSIRAARNGAIGSERKGSRDRKSDESLFTAASVSSEDGTSVGGRLVEVKSDANKDIERRKSPLTFLNNAEKKAIVY